MAQVNLPNIIGFVQGNFRKVIHELGDLLPDHIKEQAVWRLKKVKATSPECFTNDKCVHCECQVTAKVFEDRGCEKGCYPKMMTSEQWENSLIEKADQLLYNTNKITSEDLEELEYISNRLSTNSILRSAYGEENFNKLNSIIKNCKL